jgi:hypothetical protein
MLKKRELYVKEKKGENNLKWNGPRKRNLNLETDSPKFILTAGMRDYNLNVPIQCIRR